VVVSDWVVLSDWLVDGAAPVGLSELCDPLDVVSACAGCDGVEADWSAPDPGVEAVVDVDVSPTLGAEVLATALLPPA
jgi:hypothetical protein